MNLTKLRCLKGQYTIHIDSSVQHVVHNPWQIPVAFCKDLKKNIDDMEAKKMIKKPTDCLNSLGIAKKTRQERCVYVRTPNT